MAPRRGGSGGSSSDSGVPACPGAFSTPIEQAFFASDVVFFVIFFAISIALCTFRKRTGAGKQLLGIPYMLSVLFFLVSYACSFVATVLQQCGTIEYYEYFNWQIANTVFFNLARWLLLVVVVFTLNTMLRAQLGNSTTIIKILLLAIVGVMGALTCGLMGLQGYIQWVQTEAGQSRKYYSDLSLIVDTLIRYRLAYFVLYFVSLLASCGLALMTIMSLRKRKSPAGDLIGWVIALTVVMVFWVLLLIIFAAWDYQQEEIKWQASIALSYLINFAQALSFVFIMCIAKHAAWGKTAAMNPMVGTDAYAGDPNAQMYYYQQAPVYAGTKP